MVADVVLIMGSESQRAQTKLTARENLGLQFPFAKEHPFPYVHLAAGPDKCLPSLGIELTSEEYLDFPGQMLRSCGPRGRLRMDAGTPPEQASGNDPCIVEDEEFVASQETRQIREEPVFENC